MEKAGFEDQTMGCFVYLLWKHNIELQRKFTKIQKKAPHNYLCLLHKHHHA